MLIGFGKHLLAWVLNHVQEFLLFVKCGTVLWFCGKSSLLFYRCILKSIWRRKWQLTPVFLPGKSHGQRSLAGYSPCDCKESDTTEHACACACERAHTHTLKSTGMKLFKGCGRQYFTRQKWDEDVATFSNLVIAYRYPLCHSLYCILKNFPLVQNRKTRPQ